MRIIDADALIDEWCKWCRHKPNCEEDCAFYDTVRNAPTIKTKQVKYYDDDEKVWKIGGVIANTLHDITDSYKGSEYNGNIKD